MHASSPVRQTALLVAGAALFVVGFAVGRLAPPHDVPRVAAATAVADESFAACTVPMEVGVEGLFLLDFETGDLTGGVLTRNTAKFTATFRHNVLKDLDFKPGEVKNPKFLLTTGLAELPPNAGNAVASSVLYVTDATNGVSVAYAIPWNAQQANAGGPVVAQLVPLDRAAPRGGKAK